MAFEDIDFLGKPGGKGSLVPDDGIQVSARRLGTRNGEMRHFVKISIGPALAKKLAFTEPAHAMALQFGTGADAGVVRAVARDGGAFPARRDKHGRYALTVNEATMDGLFATTFPSFIRARVAVVPPDPSKKTGHAFTFRATDEMLEVD